jgi:hypothetical protein
VLWVLAYLHFNARIIAAKQGCVGLDYARALYVTTRAELVATVRIHTNLARDTVESIVDTLSLGRHDQRNPDPALQPLIPLTSRHLAIAPNLILNSAPERTAPQLCDRHGMDRRRFPDLALERLARCNHLDPAVIL